jgi:hypothetical protein
MTHRQSGVKSVNPALSVPRRPRRPSCPRLAGPSLRSTLLRKLVTCANTTLGGAAMVPVRFDPCS